MIRSAFIVFLLIGLHSPLALAQNLNHDLATPICAIDMGSTNFKVLVGHIGPQGYVNPQGFDPMSRDYRIAVNVGTSLDSENRIPSSKLAEIEDALRQFKKVCEHFGSTRILAVGTAAFRDAKNQDEVSRVADSLGISLSILSSQQEAELGYLAATMGEEGFGAIDNGSRSFQIMSKDSVGRLTAVSFNLGYKEAFKKHFQRASRFSEGFEAFSADLQANVGAIDLLSDVHLKTIGSTPMVVARFIKGPNFSGGILTRQDIARGIRLLSRVSSKKFIANKNIQDFDKLVGGITVLNYVMKTLDYNFIEVTDRALSFGGLVQASESRF